MLFSILDVKSGLYNQIKCLPMLPYEINELLLTTHKLNDFPILNFELLNAYKF